MPSSYQQKEHGYLEVFQEVTRLISNVHDPQRVMDLVVQRLPELLEVDAATIRLRDEGTDSFILGAAWGVSDEYLSRPTIDSQEVLDSLLQGYPIAKEEIDEPIDHDSSLSLSKEGVKSILSLPITFKERVVGVLRLLTKQPREFSSVEIGFAMSLAEQVGITLSNVKMYQEMENQIKFLSELREISQLVNSTLDLDEILRTIVHKLPKIMHVKGCTIRLIQPETNQLVLAAASGLSAMYLNRGNISKEDSIYQVLEGESVSIYDAERDPRVNHHEAIGREGIKSILVIPMRNSGEIIGVLRLLTSESHFFTPGEIQFTRAVAEEGANAIQKARTYRKITLLFNQIEEHERFLQTLLDSLWLKLLVVDPEKRIIMVNEKLLKTLQTTENEILGLPYHPTIPWANQELNNCPVEIVMKKKTAMSTLENVDNHPWPEKNRWYERHIAPIQGSNGEIEFIIEAIRDVTHEKLHEQEKMKRMKLEGVIEMAGTAAHELNSPLFAALGTAQLLRDEPQSKEFQDDIDLIIRNMQKIANLTKQMTTVTGYESQEYVGDTKIIKLKSSQ